MRLSSLWRLFGGRTRVQKLRVVLKEQVLTEATRATVGRYTARRDPPHFQGDEYHAHAELPKGYEVAWSVSGARRHEGKFPANVPKDAKLAVAKVLGIDPALLEEFTWFDESIGENVLLLEVLSSEP